MFFGNEQDHDHASSSSKSSGKSEKLKATRKLSSKSLEGSLTQHEDFKSSELVTSSKKTGYIDQSNKPADIVGGVSTNQATLHNSNSPSPASCIKKSNTMSNGPAPRHRTILGRTSVSKSLKSVFVTCLKLVKTFSVNVNFYFHLVTFLGVKLPSTNKSLVFLFFFILSRQGRIFPWNPLIFLLKMSK